MFFNFMRRTLNLTLKGGNEFIVGKSLSECQFQKRDTHGDIKNLVTLSEIFGFSHFHILSKYE